MEILILRNDRSLLTTKYAEFSEGRVNYEDVMDVRSALIKMGLQPGEFVVKDDLSNIKELKKLNPELAVNMCDDFLDPKKEALVPKKLETMGIPYTGDNHEPLKICSQKALAKKRLIDFGVMTPRYQLVSSPDDKIKGLKYPLIIKPNNEHGSVGIEENSIVYNDEQLQKKLNETLVKYGKMLVEEYIEGKEVSTLVIGDKVMKVSEIVFDENIFAGKPNIMTYESKWKEDELEYAGTVRQVAKLPKQLEEKIIEESKKACKALGCTSYVRVDLRVTEDGKPYVLEVNVNPDLSKDGAVAKIAQGSKVSYTKLIKTIIETAKQATETESNANNQIVEEKKAA